MRIVFFGTPDWAVPSLDALARSSEPPSLVVTQPRKRRGRGAGVSSSPIGDAGVRLGLRVIEPGSVKSEAFLALVAAERPDLFIVVAYGRIFSRALLAVPRIGAVNLHFSLLPRYRGGAPVQWAIAQGEPETGVTTMRMVEDLDEGPVYLQRRVPIEPDEHAPRLGARLASLGAGLLLETLEGIARGGLQPQPQDLALASYARLLRSEDGWIDWTLTGEEIARRVRGFDPWPGQVARARKGKLRILEARGALAGTSPGPASAGSVMGEGEGSSVRIACGEGTALEARLVQPEGRRAMTGSEALRGRHLIEGERLGPPHPPDAEA